VSTDDAGPGWTRAEAERRFRAFAERETAASPLYQALSAAVAEDAALLDLAAFARPGQPPANMLFAAVKRLLARDPADPLADFYPGLTPKPRPAPEAPPAFRRFCLAHADAIRATLQRRAVNTNEPARAALLRPAFAVALGELTGPVHFVEVGASAGLVLLWPYCAVDPGQGGAPVGPADPGLTFPCAMTGDPPLHIDPARVASLQGIERDPLDPADPEDADWLRALIWPEQLDRAARMDAALALARRAPPRVHHGDALEILPELAAALPVGGALVVHHQFTLNQFPDDTRDRFHAQLSRIAQDRPVRRVGLEWSGRDRAAVLDLATPDAGPRRLARCDPHGAWLVWEGAAQ
jgi:hypothetical protein